MNVVVRVHVLEYSSHVHNYLHSEFGRVHSVHSVLVIH